MTDGSGVVLFGDVVGSRRDAAASTAWLRDLVHELDEAYGEERLALFGFTRGDELQGVLDPRADPLTAILRAALRPGGYRMRWVVVLGAVDVDSTDGKAPATECTGPAFLAARTAIEGARASHDRLVIDTGRAEVDALLADLTPALVDSLDGLTERQRTVARLALIDDLRQSEVADRLNVRRATISVAFSRAHVRPLQRLVAGIRRVYSSGSDSDVPNPAARSEPEERRAGSGAATE
ncbi:MAG: SatD family protein [Candidatus Limnocylindrales bacterium]